jgi:hypothetical protein
MRQVFLVVSLLLVFAVLTISSLLQQSGTCDEIAHHIPAGHSYYKKWDFRLNPSNPPLSRYFMALPLNFLDLKAPLDDRSWQEADTPTFGNKFLFEYNKDKTRLIIFLSRLPMVLLGLLTGILVYFIALQIYGKQAATFSLFLFSLTPEILAHSGLATTDIAFTCFTLLALVTFMKLMKSLAKLKIFIAGIALGLAQLSKYSAVMLYPIFLILTLIECLSLKKVSLKLFNSLILVFVISIITVWAGYGFRIQPFLAETTKPQEKIAFVQDMGSRFLPFWDNKAAKNTETFLKNMPLPLTTYITGLFGVMKHEKEGHKTFFAGKWSDYGNPFYYLVAFLIKTPVSIILFFVIAIFTITRIKIKKEELYVIVPALFIFTVASLNKLQLGLRYILPVYPLIIIFCSRFILSVRVYWQRLLITTLAIWLVMANIAIWPHYLSYFNEFIGGPDNGWKYLRDSNIDWGQDLPALSRYLRNNGISEVYLKYFGTDSPEYYGIQYRQLGKEDVSCPQKKVYAISAHYLEGVDWTVTVSPTAKAGYSIFIYDFRDKT